MSYIMVSSFFQTREHRDHLRQALKSCAKFIAKILDVLDDVLISPFTPREILHERQKL